MVVVAKTVREARAALKPLRLAGRLGLVPTMGALHQGHLNLVSAAARSCDAVAVSIFVNPTQFAPNEDLSKYPRNLQGDLSMLKSVAEKANKPLVVFAPEPSEVYLPGYRTAVVFKDIETTGQFAEATARPGHFSGVGTVVSKLFNIMQPDMAFFGAKDALQCIMIRQLVRDMNIPVDLVFEETTREPDGLAMSSRNLLLPTEARAIAPILYKALSKASDEFNSGTTEVSKLYDTIMNKLKEESRVTVQYVSIADSVTGIELAKHDHISTARPGLVSLASCEMRRSATH